MGNIKLNLIFVGVLNSLIIIDLACILLTTMDAIVSSGRSTVSAREIQEDLKCVNCQKVPTAAPIYDCLNGHLLCNRCHQGTYNICPECNIQLGGHRNLFAETVLSRLPLPCKFAYKGCTIEIIGKDNIEKHELECIIGTIVCIRKECEKKMAVPKLAHHMTVDHQCMSWEQNADFFTFPIAIEKSIYDTFKQYEETHFNIDGRDFFSEIVRTEKGFWFAGVFCVSTNDMNDEKYSYEMKIRSDDNIEEIQFHGECLPVEEISITSFMNGEASCLMFNDAMVKKFTEKMLQVEIKIQTYYSQDYQDHSNQSFHSDY